MNRLWIVFRTQLATGAKVAVVAGLLLLVIAFAVGAGVLVSRFKDDAFAKRESERETQREQLQHERDQALGRAEAAEKRESELAAKVAINEAIVAAAGARAEQAASKLEEEDKRYVQEMANAGVDVSADERRQRVCERLAKLGYKSEGCNQ